MAKRKGHKAPATRKGTVATVNDGAARSRSVEAFGHLHRNGGGRVWTATNGRAKASREACRKGAW